MKIIQSKADKIQDRLKYWWNFNNWNKFDFLILVLALFAMLLRLKLAIDQWNNNRVMVYRCSKTMYSITGRFIYNQYSINV